MEELLLRGRNFRKLCNTLYNLFKHEFKISPLSYNKMAFIEPRKSYKATPTSSLLVTNLTIADLILLFQLIHQVKNDINGGLRKVFKWLHDATCILLVNGPLENWRHFENLSSDYLTSFGCRFGSFIHQLCITVMDSRSASPLAPIILGYFGYFIQTPAEL